MSTVRTPAYLTSITNWHRPFRHPCAEVLTSPHPNVFSYLPHRTIFVRGSEKSRPVPINFIHNFSDLVRSGATTPPAAFQNT